MLYEPLCKRCNQPGKIICFCSSIVICESCIGLHLIEDPELPHKPIAITHSNYKHSSRNNSLSSEEQEFLSAIYLKQEQTQEIKFKLQKELEELEEFKESSLRAISDFIKVGEKKFFEEMSKSKDKVVLACEVVRKELIQAIGKINSADENSVLSALVGKNNLKKIDLVKKHFKINESELWTKLSSLMNISVSLSLPSKNTIKNYSVDVIEEEEPLAKLDMTFSGRTVPKKPQMSKIKTFAMPPAKSTGKAQQPTLFYLNFTTNEVNGYDVCSDSVSSFSIKREKLAENAAWTATGDGRIIITGGIDGIALRKTLSLNVQSREVKRFENMNISRHSHAQVLLGSFVYAIGGYYNTPLKQCEKLYLNTGKWKKIGNLSIARHCHGACVHNGRIYVVGGDGVDTIETLNTVSDKFSLLRLRVSPSPCVLFSENDKILVLQEDKIRALITSGTASYVVGDINPLRWLSRTQSVSFGGQIFFLVNAQIYAYSAATHSIEPIFIFN